ncbi:DUF805 domain-containing protein [Enterococcus sp. AZ109]|uniref:DUF805 domain-containing protein n=1 Tax=Enterococcus sp. AZ109 TaxID=2774634 RepID=UPI003F24F7D3
MKMINQKPGEVSFTRAVKDYFLGYVEFKGRTTRAGYWWVRLITMLFNFFVIVLAFGLFFKASVEALQFYDYEYVTEEELGLEVILALMPYLPLLILFVFIYLAFFLPDLALTCRRLRDTGLSGRGILAHYLVIAGLTIFQYTFKIAEVMTYESSTYSVAALFCSVLLTGIGVELFIFTLMPTNELTTNGKSGFQRFFFRAKELPIQEIMVEENQVNITEETSPQTLEED